MAPEFLEFHREHGAVKMDIKSIGSGLVWLWPLKDVLQFNGHMNYYAITDNSDSCHLYMHLATRALFKWLNRRSQRKSYTWDGFHHALRHVGWPSPRVRVDMNPFCPIRMFE